jgi:uncharacterized protein (TIRG00374 family)
MTTSKGSAALAVRRLWDGIKIILALGLIGLVLLRTDLVQLKETLQSLTLSWVLLALMVYLVLTALKAFQYFVLLRGRVTYLQVLNVIILQNAVSNFLASSAGIASYITMLRMDHDVKVSRSALVFVLTKLGDLFAIWLFLVFSSFLAWSQIDLLQKAVLILGLVLGVLLLIFFVTIALRQRFVKLVKTMLIRLRLAGWKPIRAGVELLDMLAGVDQVWLAGRFAVLLTLSVLYFGLAVLMNYALFMAFGFQVDVLPLIFVNVMLQLVSYFPIMVFGGLGVTETSSLYLWGLFGIQQPVLVPVLVGNRILFYFFNVLPLIYLPMHARLTVKA